MCFSLCGQWNISPLNALYTLTGEVHGHLKVGDVQV